MSASAWRLRGGAAADRRAGGGVQRPAALSGQERARGANLLWNGTGFVRGAACGRRPDIYILRFGAALAGFCSAVISWARLCPAAGAFALCIARPSSRLSTLGSGSLTAGPRHSWIPENSWCVLPQDRCCLLSLWSDLGLRSYHLAVAAPRGHSSTPCFRFSYEARPPQAASISWRCVAPGPCRH